MIETLHRDNVTILRLIGRVRGEHVPPLERLLTESGAAISLDLGEVTLVDAEVIKFLASCGTRAIPLMRCPSYITEWIAESNRRAADVAVPHAVEPGDMQMKDCDGRI